MNTWDICPQKKSPQQFTILKKHTLGKIVLYFNSLKISKYESTWHCLSRELLDIYHFQKDKTSITNHIPFPLGTAYNNRNTLNRFCHKFYILYLFYSLLKIILSFYGNIKLVHSKPHWFIIFFFFTWRIKTKYYNIWWVKNYKMDEPIVFQKKSETARRLVYIVVLGV